MLLTRRVGSFTRFRMGRTTGEYAARSAVQQAPIVLDSEEERCRIRHILERASRGEGF